MRTLQLDVKKESYIGKIVGLIGEKTPRTIVFHTRFGIHTFGVRFPIDVVILNKKNEIVKIKQSLKPNHFFFWNPKYNTVIELPAETIEQKKLTVGDKIIFSY